MAKLITICISMHRLGRGALGSCCDDVTVNHVTLQYSPHTCVQWHQEMQFEICTKV